MTIESRLAEIRARVDAATEGPWTAEYSGEQGNCVLPPGYQSTREAVAITRLLSAQADAEFIAASRPDVPWLLGQVELRDKALKDALDLHAPKPIYVLAEDCEASEDHEHGPAPDGGSDICWDEPTGETYCNECNDVWGDPVDYPCPTVQALTAALDANTTREDQS